MTDKRYQYIISRIRAYRGKAPLDVKKAVKLPYSDKDDMIKYLSQRDAPILKAIVSDDKIPILRLRGYIHEITLNHNIFYSKSLSNGNDKTGKLS